MTLKLGIRAHDFGKLPLEQMAAKVGSFGFRSIQLALAKAIADMDSGLGKLSPGYANHVAETFGKHGVRVAVLGCYINPINPDKAERRYEIDRFKEHLRYARDFGTSLVATETGRLDTYLKDYPNDYKEKAWTILRETVEELAEQAEKYGVIAAIEPATSLVIHSTEGMLRMLEEVPSPNLGVLIDPCNLMDTDNIVRQDEVMKEAFEALAARTVLIHAKDIKENEKGRFEYTGLGTGLLNYPLFLQLVRQYKPHIDITLEGVTEEHLPASLDFFTKTWNEVKL
ncbi:sugar phosphate isomerase/epimerase [Paenibacillus sp. GD4]|jgi:sugar phosphate isomerase/epimerase|uniref:sugar phosphate isomerase/epimerase family protein n=1 Tax=Paenibacillus sp. GD4 TaxID=3068890 RepID=UPI002796C69F|nr:sugar phosphate isomerase/epimerase [Paenibacillus sp. GD4]MDQ1909047.1 sugar phosphate isomerase/epimerase [Paenibacillus sp. GD4]